MSFKMQYFCHAISSVAILYSLIVPIFSDTLNIDNSSKLFFQLTN